MKPFRFRLQSVLSLRAQEKHAAERAYAGTLRAQEAAAGRVRAAEAEIEACQVLQRAKVASGVSARELVRLLEYQSTLLGRRQQFVAAWQLARQAVDGAWQHLVTTSRGHQALDKLRGRQRRAHEGLAAQLEQKQLDEFAGRAAALAESWRDTPDSTPL